MKRSQPSRWSTLIATTAAGLLVPVLAAAQTHEAAKLIERIVRGAEGDADAAARLVAAGKELSDDPEAQVLVCEKAYDYGIKSADGHDSALEALDILTKIDGKRAAIWAEKRIKIFRLRYTRAAGTDKQRHGKLLVGMLVKMADRQAAGRNFSEAAALYSEALTIAGRLHLSGRDQISEKLRATGHGLRLQGLVDRLKAKLKADPGDTASRNSLIYAYLVDMDSPDEAAKYLSKDCEEKLRACLPLATKALEKLKDSECLQLGRWYPALAGRAGAKADKIKMLRRARTYVSRYLEIHIVRDADRRKAALLLEHLDEAIAKLTGAPWSSVLKGAVLALTFERSTFSAREGRKYVRDASSRGNDGRVHGGQIVQGRAGTAMKFDSKGYIDLGNPKDLQITGDLTICMWINPEGIGSRQVPFSKARSGEGTLVMEKGGRLSYLYGSAGGDDGPCGSYSMPKPLVAGKWSHVAVVRDMKSRKVTWYADGASVFSAAARHKPAASKNNLHVGKGPMAGFRGMLDEVVMFGRALTAKEIKAVYEQGRNGRPLRR